MATTGTEKSDVEITTWSVQEPNAAHSGLCGERCKKFVHTAVVAIMILIVWGLIIVSAVSSYIPRDYKHDESDEEMNDSAVSHESMEIMNNAATTMPNLGTVRVLNCSDAFYASNGTCLPRCDRWKQYPDDVSIALDAVVIGMSMIRVVFGIIALVASCINWRTMFAFPAVLIIHLNATTLCTDLLDLIAYTDRKALFCSSMSVIDTLNKSTAFCSTYTVIFYYLVFHNSICWFCHVVTLFWQIMFPFLARRCKNNGMNKYLYIAVLVPALLLPAVPGIAGFATGGFAVRTFPPSLCFTKNGSVVYYTVVLPTSAMSVIGATLLIIVISELIKRRTTKEQNGKRQTNVGLSADTKVIFFLCYFLFFYSTYIAIIGVNSNVNLNAEFAEKATEYFVCEANGYDVNKTCNSERMAYEALTYPGFIIAFHVLFVVYPATTLIFIVRMKRKSLKRKSLASGKPATIP